MAEIGEETKRSNTPAGNFSFDVSIQSAGGMGGVGELVLQLPVDAVRGLGDSRTNVIRHRTNGFSATTLTPFPGLSTPDAVTLEGSWLYDAEDLKKLQRWRNQVRGKLDVGVEAIGGIYRDITIHPTIDNEFMNTVLVGSAFIKLFNCIATRLVIADFDVNAPAVSSWSIEIEFEDMRILEE